MSRIILDLRNAIERINVINFLDDDGLESKSRMRNRRLLSYIELRVFAVTKLSELVVERDPRCRRSFRSRQQSIKV